MLTATAPATAPLPACLPALPPLTAVVPSAEGLAALEAQRQRVRGVKAEVSEIKADRSFMRASKAFNKQAGRGPGLGRAGSGGLDGQALEQHMVFWVPLFWASTMHATFPLPGVCVCACPERLP